MRRLPRTGCGGLACQQEGLQLTAARSRLGGCSCALTSSAGPLACPLPLQLFQAEPTPVPVSSSAGGYQPAGLASPNAAGATSPPLGFGTASTLDEPIWHTIKRDLKRIYKNLVMVVFPFKDRSQQSAALRNWDLWGPMVRRGASGVAGRAAGTRVMYGEEGTSSWARSHVAAAAGWGGSKVLYCPVSKTVCCVG